MSDRCLELQMNSGRKGNFIPLGRQLPRTPPYQNSSKQSRVAQQMGNEETYDLNSTLECKSVRQVPLADPQSMLKGMKGYQLTPVDLEFMQKMNEEKELKNLQGDLKELQKVLMSEMMALEGALLSKEKAEAELLQLPSREEIRKWSKVVLEVTAPSTEIAELDTKSLLALVTTENIEKVIKAKKTELKALEKMVEKRKRKHAIERGQLEKQIAFKQAKTQNLMRTLSELKSKLASQEEANKSLKPLQAPEIKTEAVGGDKTAEGVPAANSQVKPKRRKPPAKTEKLKDATLQSKPTKRVNNWKNVVKDETSTTEKTKQLTGLVSEWKKESVPQGSEVKGRRKAAESVQFTDSQAKTQRKVKVAEPQPTSQPAAPGRGRKKATITPPEAAQGQDAGLRRSKRNAKQK